MHPTRLLRPAMCLASSRATVFNVPSLAKTLSTSTTSSSIPLGNHDTKVLTETPAARSSDSKASSSAPRPRTTNPSKIVRQLRYPRNVQALYLKPLRCEAEYGIPSCDLQLRSFSLRNLEFFCDFALRAAYYLKLPAFGPVPLPRITERWTVPRSSFIFKKSQENFERITLRRLIQIRDGNPETVQLWLAFLQKHAYYGLGMKANIWEFSPLGVGKSMGELEEDVAQMVDTKWEHLAQHKTIGTMAKVEEILASRRFKGIMDEKNEEQHWDEVHAKRT